MSGRFQRSGDSWPLRSSHQHPASSHLQGRLVTTNSTAEEVCVPAGTLGPELRLPRCPHVANVTCLALQAKTRGWQHCASVPGEKAGL